MRTVKNVASVEHSPADVAYHSLRNGRCDTPSVAISKSRSVPEAPKARTGARRWARLRAAPLDSRSHHLLAIAPKSRNFRNSKREIDTQRHMLLTVLSTLGIAECLVRNDTTGKMMKVTIRNVESPSRRHRSITVPSNSSRQSFVSFMAS